MELEKYTQAEQAQRVSLLILEDEDPLREAYQRHLSNVEFIERVVAVKFFAEAKDSIEASDCDLFYTDLIIASRTGGRENARRLLKLIQERNLPISSIATSAHEEDLSSIEQEGLAQFTIRKDSDPDFERSIKSARFLANSIYSVRVNLLSMLFHLRKASEEADILEAAGSYFTAKEIISSIHDLDVLPRVLHEIIWQVRAFVYFLAPFNSRVAHLRKLDDRALMRIERVVSAVNSGDGRISQISTNAFNELAAQGYQVRPLSDESFDGVLEL